MAAVLFVSRRTAARAKCYTGRNSSAKFRPIDVAPRAKRVPHPTAGFGAGWETSESNVSRPEGGDSQSSIFAPRAVLPAQGAHVRHPSTIEAIAPLFFFALNCRRRLFCARIVLTAFLRSLMADALCRIPNLPVSGSGEFEVCWSSRSGCKLQLVGCLHAEFRCVKLIVCPGWQRRIMRGSVPTRLSHAGWRSSAGRASDL